VTNTVLTPGDDSAEGLSIVGTLDGGITLRVGANLGDIKRRFYINGYDATGRDIDDSVDVRNEDRQTYGEEDPVYQFHDMTKVASGVPKHINEPITNPDIAGHSLDAHLVRNAWLRIGCDKEDLKSLTLDTDGSVITHFGADNRDTVSWTGEFDGGIQTEVGASQTHHYSLRSLLHGGVNAKIGKENEDDNSLIIELDGGMKIKIGKNKEKEQSINVQASNGAQFEISEPDKDGYALRVKMKGNVLFDVDGNVDWHCPKFTVAGPGGGAGTVTTMRGDFKTPDDTTAPHSHPGAGPNVAQYT